MPTWRERVLERMAELGVRQADLPEVLGVGSRQAVSLYLRGEREPTVDQFAALCKYLDLSLDYAVFGRQSRTPQVAPTRRRRARPC